MIVYVVKTFSFEPTGVSAELIKGIYLTEAEANSAMNALRCDSIFSACKMVRAELRGY